MATKSSIFSSQEHVFDQIEENTVKDESRMQDEKPQKPKKKRRYAMIDDSEERKKGVKNKMHNDQAFESTEEFGQPIPELYPELYDAVVKVDNIGTPPSPEERYDSQDSQPIGVKKRRKMSKPKKVKIIIEDDEHSEHDSTHDSIHEDSKQRVGSWVQCCRPECGKWRCLNVTVDPCEVADKWVCTMNPDCTYNTCGTSQEAFDSQDEDFDVVYTSYPEGTIVWAKVAGYPWWPGMMEKDPDYGYYCETEESSRIPISYHVVFFDKEVSRAWISTCNVRLFQADDEPGDQGSVVFRGKNYKKKLDTATEQAKQAIVHPPEERLKVYGFAIRYSGTIRRKRKTPKEKKKKENGPDREENTEENVNDDTPNSMGMDIESSEDFPAGSESSDNFSQEMRKQSAKTKKFTPASKTDKNVKASKKPVTDKSIKSRTKKPKIQSTSEAKPIPSLVAQGAGRKIKTSKKLNKSVDKSDKASSKDTETNINKQDKSDKASSKDTETNIKQDKSNKASSKDTETNIKQDLHAKREENSSTTPSNNHTYISNNTSQDKSSLHDEEPPKNNAPITQSKDQFINPKKRTLKKFKENEEKKNKEKDKVKSGSRKPKKSVAMSVEERKEEKKQSKENEEKKNKEKEKVKSTGGGGGGSRKPKEKKKSKTEEQNLEDANVAENVSAKSVAMTVEERKEEKKLSKKLLFKSNKNVTKYKPALKESVKDKNTSSPKKLQSSSPENNTSSPNKLQSSSPAQAKQNPPQVSASMPKLLKPAFKPPSKNESTDAKMPSKPRKMPKLKKAQFIQPPKSKEKHKTNKPRKEASGRSPMKRKTGNITRVLISNVDGQGDRNFEVSCPDIADEVEVELAKLDEDIENMKKTFKPSSVENHYCDDSPEF